MTTHEHRYKHRKILKSQIDVLIVEFNVAPGNEKQIGKNCIALNFNKYFLFFTGAVVTNAPTLHFHSPSEINVRTAMLHLLPRSRKRMSSMQYTVTLSMDQASAKVVICTLVTILLSVDHKAILDTQINSPRVICL